MRKVCIIRHGYFYRDPRVRKEVAALVEDGCDVDVLCLREPGQKKFEKICDVNVYRIPVRRRRGKAVSYVIEYAASFLLFTTLLSYLYFRKRYDVIQVNTMPDILVFATLIPKLCGTKVLLDMHEAMPELYRSKFGFHKRHPVVKFLELSERLSTRYANKVLVVGDTIRELYLTRGLNERKTLLIPNVPNDDLFDGQKFGIRKTGNRKDFVVFTHGSFLERYGIQVLIRAAPYLKQSIQSLKLVIVGDGEFRESLEEVAKSYEVENIVNFKGFMPLEMVPLEISKANIGIVPIIKDEFTDIMAPNKLFEYVAMKKAVVAPRLRGILDYFDDSCVMFFESGDHEDLARCITELYNHPERRKKLAGNAYRRYEKIRWNKTKVSYVNAINSLINSDKK